MQGTERICAVRVKKKK